MVRNFLKRAWLGMSLLAFLLPLTAGAVGLGKLTIHSTLGQPLRAEIELLAVQKEELGSINARLASAEAFKDAKVERTASMLTFRFKVDQRANGEPYLRLTSSQPINDAFLDMLIEVSWPSGRLLREYTVLLDPPSTAAETQQAAVAPSIPATASSAPAKSAPTASKSSRSNRRARVADTDGSEAASPASSAPSSSGGTYPVKKGDTLLKIAHSVRPEGVSVDQMLVALYQANKDAFIGNNIHRLKSGQILQVPDEATAAKINVAEAGKEIKVHSNDWNAYRQKLAKEVDETPAAKEKGAQQSATGKISTTMEDKGAAQKDASKDVLKLSRADARAKPGDATSGTANSGAAATKDTQALQDKIRALQEEATAKDKTVQESNERISQLEKQIKEMQRLLEIRNQNLADLQKQAAGGTADKGQAPLPPSPPVTQQPGAAGTPTEIPSGQPSAPVAGDQPTVTPPATPAPDQAKAPATAPVQKPAPVQEPQPEPSLLDTILTNPLYLLLAIGGLLALVIAGITVLGNKRKKRLSSFEDSIMTDSDLKANTVFGDTKGGAIDTGNTSFLTDFSQAGMGTIDTHDVDPIAEAEVYMAYGRDAQAEEILKEALAKNPTRHVLHLKLLEIYAARKNTVAFETLAGELYASTGGESSDVWEKAAAMGKELDPDNPLYSVEQSSKAKAQRTVAQNNTYQAPKENAPEDADPGLDFSLDRTTQASANEYSEEADLVDLNTTSGDDYDTIIPQAVEKHSQAVDEYSNDLAQDASVSDADDRLEMPSRDEVKERKAKTDDSELDFNFELGQEDDPMSIPGTVDEEALRGPVSQIDLSNISLEMEDQPQPDTNIEVPPVGSDPHWHEVATKLDLAKAYLEMGDNEGAKEILQEVVQEGDAQHRQDAQKLLANL